MTKTKIDDGDFTALNARAKAIEECAVRVISAHKEWWTLVERGFAAKRAWQKAGSIGPPPHSDLGPCEEYIASAIRALRNSEPAMLSARSSGGASDAE